MKIVVTGASGYVGGVILAALRKAGHETHAWSRRECAPPWRKFELGMPLQERAWNGCEVLIHAANDFSARGWNAHQRLNIQPSLELLESAHRAGVPTLLYISSMSAFDGTPSHYGQAKRAVELQWISKGGIVVRPGLVWGDQPGGVMGAIDSMVRKLPIIPVLWSRNGLPQFLVHEEDLAETLRLLSTEAPSGISSIIHACHPRPVPLSSLVKHLVRARHLHRLFLPVPGSLALLGLRLLEAIGITPPFRSDSLIGLMGGRTSLDGAHQPISYQPFPDSRPAPHLPS